MKYDKPTKGCDQWVLGRGFLIQMKIDFTSNPDSKSEWNTLLLFDF
jgi:hypothetical protein